MGDFVTFAQNFGLALALLLFALITGSLGKWYFATYVTELKVQYESRLAQLMERLAEKNAQIEGWQRVAENNGAIAVESLAVAKQTKAILDKIDVDIRRKVRDERKAPIVLPGAVGE